MVCGVGMWVQLETSFKDDPGLLQLLVVTLLCSLVLSRICRLLYSKCPGGIVYKHHVPQCLGTKLVVAMSL